MMCQLTFRRALLVMFALLGWLHCDAINGHFALGQDKQPDEAAKPAIHGAVPLGLSPGVLTKVTLHGDKLDRTSKVTTNVAGATVTLRSTTALPPPGKKEPKRSDDSKIEIELTLPADFLGETVELTAVTPAGETPPRAMRVVAKDRLVEEREPNDGFRQAQKIQRDQTIAGAIQNARDVDVFAYQGRVGEKLRCEVFAARFGSPLDSLLTIYDADTHVIGVNDDAADTTDSQLRVTLPADGVYYLTLMDAHDHGSADHVYQLTVTAEAAAALPEKPTSR